MTGAALDRRKLRLIAARFASNHEGEQLAALTLANGLLARAGMSWSELLEAPPPEEAVEQEHEKDLEQMVREHPMRFVFRLLRREDGLTAWERQFLERLQGFRRPSAKQLAVLVEIARTVAEFDAA